MNIYRKSALDIVNLIDKVLERNYTYYNTTSDTERDAMLKNPLTMFYPIIDKGMLPKVRAVRDDWQKVNGVFSYWFVRIKTLSIMNDLLLY